MVGGATVNTFVHLNYLAHFFLAYPSSDLMFGNYIGDGLKGSDLSAYSEGVQRGVRFHRHIDTYTDTHVLVKEAKTLFYPTQAKYSGVVVDVLFDHLLAQFWEEYAQMPLAEFAQQCYMEVINHQEEMPPRSKGYYRYMVQENILQAYSDELGIQRVFRGMDSRTPFPSNMEQSVNELRAKKEELSSIFRSFFPDLINETQQWQVKH